MVTADFRPDVVPGVVDDTLYASWTSRVIGTVIDGLVFGGMYYLIAGAAAGTSTFTLPVIVFGSSGFSLEGLSWGMRATVLGAALVLLLPQAYGGASPGKRIVGIVVVDDQTGRPVGLLRTLVRGLAHLLDAILLIGYLRPLWNAERRTFADSVVGTVALRTRTVRPHPLVEGALERSQGKPASRTDVRGSMGEPASRTWQNRVTGGVLVLSIVLAGFSFPWMSTSSRSGGVCSVFPPEQSEFQPDVVDLSTDASTTSERRLWLARTTVHPLTEVVARWTWDGDAPRGTVLHLAVRSADGTTLATTSAPVEEGATALGPLDEAADSSTGTPGEVRLDTAGLSIPADGWTIDSDLVIDGQRFVGCGIPG